MRCPKPRRFKPAGDISWAVLGAGPAFSKRSPRRRGVRAKGVNYEKRVHAKLSSIYDEAYVPGPWIHFQTGSEVRWCQPDGLLFDIPGGHITVIEVKFNHTSDAWWQLRHLYGPVVRFMFPTFQVHLLEVCQWYDCAVTFPEEIVMREDVHGALPDRYNLHIYRPSRSDP